MLRGASAHDEDETEQVASQDAGHLAISYAPCHPCEQTPGLVGRGIFCKVSLAPADLLDGA